MRTGTEAPTSQPAYDELVSRERQPITPPTIILRTPAPTDDLDAERACLSPDELHHANTLREEGLTKEQIWEGVKVGAVVQAVAQAIEIEAAR